MLARALVEQGPRAEGLAAIAPPPRINPGDIDVHIYPGDDIDDIADASPKGATFLIHGTHYRQTVSPRDGQQFHGASDAVVDGDNRVVGALNTHDLLRAGVI